MPVLDSIKVSTSIRLFSPPAILPNTLSISASSTSIATTLFSQNSFHGLFTHRTRHSSRINFLHRHFYESTPPSRSIQLFFSAPDSGFSVVSSFFYFSSQTVSKVSLFPPYPTLSIIHLISSSLPYSHRKP